jgi:hypothetical protein
MPAGTRKEEQRKKIRTVENLTIFIIQKYSEQDKKGL